MTANTKYGFYLANGLYVEYDLLPDSSLVDIIDQLALAYSKANGNVCALSVWMQPKYASLLNKELSQRCPATLGYLTGMIYPQFIKIQTLVGAVMVLVKPQLHLPIFFGSEKELEDNSFSMQMDKILAPKS